MQPVVETLSGLERRVDLAVSMADVEKAVQERLKRIARTTKVPGFRPGKAPLAIVERSHGPGIRYDAINTQVAEAFNKIVANAQLRVAGAPTLAPKTDDAPEGTLSFSATFEVYPEVVVPDLSTLSIQRATISVGDAEIDRTIDVLRKQRAKYEVRAGRAAQTGDRVTLDFAGVIDGVPFEGGKAEDFSFVLGQGRMLPEFEAAAQGMLADQTKTFPLSFPDDYAGKEVAGKTAEFTITVKAVAETILPTFDAELAKSLGQADGDVEALRADIRKNVEREAQVRTQARTKANVMDALAAASSFEVPKVLVSLETERRVAAAREELKQRGVPNADSIPMPTDVFAAESERRVRLGLVVSELIKQAQLQARPEQVRARIETFAQNYEQPAQVVRYYLTDAQRRAEIEAVVREDNVVEYVLSQAKVSDEAVPFEQLMGTA